MKTAATILALAGAANAFAPASVKSSKNGLQMSVFDDYAGNVNFKGDEFNFDPLNLSETYSPFVPFFRESELRHGRTAMLAVTGWIAADFVRVPGEAYSFSAVPQVAGAHDAMPDIMQQLFFWIALFDICITAPAIGAMNKGEREPGDYGLDPLKRMQASPEKVLKTKNSELMNGRLAMMAIGGIATQSILSGHGFPYV